MGASRKLLTFVVVTILAAAVQAEPGCPGSESSEAESKRERVDVRPVAHSKTECSFLCWDHLCRSYLRFLFVQPTVEGREHRSNRIFKLGGQHQARRCKSLKLLP